MKLTLSQVESLANELIAFHTAAGDIPTGWTFKFNRQTSAVGLCVYRDRTIQVSKKWAEVLDEKVIKIVGKSKIVIVKIQFHTEMESVLCREIAFENIDAALELILP